MAATAPAPVTWPKWSEVMEVIERNPNRAKTLSVNTLYGQDMTKAELSISPPGLTTDWEEYTIYPGGHLSAIMYCRDRFFADAPGKLREQMLIDAAIEVPQDIDEKIRTTSFARQRKKALEWLGTAPGKLGTVESRQLWEILMTVYNYQCIVISEKSRDLYFAPSDVRTWTAEKPLLIVDKELSRVWLSLKWNSRDLVGWLDNYDVEWPVAEGTKVDLIGEWEKNPAYKEEDRKKRKEEIGLLVGKSQSIQHLMTLTV